MTHTIRNATLEDLSFILQGIENNRVLENRPPDQIKASDEDKKSSIRGIENQWVRIIEIDGQMAGFFCYRTDLDIMYHDEKIFWIDLIYVDAGYRGRGLGKVLYSDAGKIANRLGFPKIIVDVFDANNKSMAFHHDMGFRKIYGIFELPVV